MSAIMAGVGFGIVPHWLVRDDLASGRLLSALDHLLTGHLPIHLLWPTSPIMLPRLRVAIDAIADVVRPFSPLEPKLG